MEPTYDAIVVGARCAGAPTAMLLARAGHRVLLVDKATFPSDTVSTLMIHAPGAAALRRWGVLDDVVATGCQPIETYRFDFGPLVLQGACQPVDGSSTAYAPRRYLLDEILVNAAVDAGVDVRQGFSVAELLVDDGVVTGIRGCDADGNEVTETATIVIGADGRSSKVARAVGAAEYETKPILMSGFYTYFRDLPVGGFETYIRPDRGFAAIPTNDGLTLVVVGWPAREYADFKTDPEGNFMATLELAPEFAERVRKATRVERFTAAAVPNVFRVPHGPGWALVGDAGCTMDPITAAGMRDAFLDAERFAAAISAGLSGEVSMETSLKAAHEDRDTYLLPRYAFTTDLATLAPPPPEQLQILVAAAGNQEATDGFVSLVAGVLTPMEYFAPDNVEKILAGASA